MSMDTGVLPAPALASESASGGFGEHLAKVSAELDSAAPGVSAPASAKRETLGEGQRLVANALVAPLAVPAKAPGTSGIQSLTEESTAPEDALPAMPAAVEGDSSGTHAPDAKGATDFTSAKTNGKSQGNSKSTQRPEQPTQANRNVVAAVAVPGQAPSPLPVGLNVLLGHTDVLEEQASDMRAASSQPETSASGSQLAGIAVAPPETPSNGGQQTSEDETKTLKGAKTTGVDAPAGSASELAFAAKVQPAAAASQPSPDSSGRSFTETVAATAAAIRKAAADAESAHATGATEVPLAVSSMPASNIAAAFQQPDSLASTPKTTASTPTGPTNELQAPQQEQSPGSAAPLKDVSLRIEQPQGQNVEVRVVERGGELRVAVHGGDSDVVQGLRQNLSELTDRLSESGFHAETWRPAASEASAATSENKNSSGNSGGSDSQQQQSWSQQGRGQRDQNQSNRPPWVQEFETSLTGGAAPTGQFDGLSS